MCGNHPTQAITGVAILAVLIVSPGVACAGRIGPAPLLSQFEEGYGSAAAEVVDAKLVTAPDKYPALYDVVFKIHEVAAQPLQGEVFALNQGDSITIRLSAGYACQVEWNVESALAKGKCYYLILRRKKDGTFEHADGASAVRTVARFEASETQYYARVRALAGEPKDRRLLAWVNVVTKPTESDRLRSDALAGVFRKLWTDAKAADGDGAARTLLRQFWNDPQANLSLALLEHLDYVLRGTTLGFEDSSDRRDVWLKTLLTLTPERRKRENNEGNIDNLAHSILRDLAKRHPDATGQQLAARLGDKKWPALYRRGISSGLLTAYQYADRVDPKWEPALDAYFIDLVTVGEPFPIRVAAGDLAYFAGVESPGDSGARRWYSPNEKVRAALIAGVERLKTAAGRPGADQEFGTSASELARVLRLLDGPRRPFIPPMPVGK
jgi:hypothetical protein